MRDNLDLQELRERADNYTNQSRRVRNRALIFILGGMIILLWLYLQTRDPLGQIYNKGDELSEVFYNDAIVDVQTADDGTIWIQTIYSEKMIHATTDDWRTYRGDDISDCCFDFDGVFAVYGNRVWAQSEKNLAYYDGTKWSVELNYFGNPKINELAVNSQGVFVIDSEYNFYINTDDLWISRSLAYLYSQDLTPPTFINVEDVMYLHLKGLRRFNGDSWNFVASLPANSVFLGNDNTHIWLQADDALVTYHTIDNKVQFLPLKEIGLPPETSINHVFQDNQGVTLFATDTSIYQLDDDKWNFVESIDTLYGIKTVGVLPDDTWVITSTDVGFAGTPSADSYYSAHLFIPFLSPIIILVAIMILWVRPSQKLNSKRIEPFREFISITTLVEDFEDGSQKIKDEPKSKLSPFARLIGFIVIMMFMPSILIMLNIPQPITFPIGVLIAFSFLFLPTIRVAFNLKDKSEQTRQARQKLLFFFMPSLGAVILMPVLVSTISLIFPVIEDPFILLFILYGIVILLYYVYMIYVKRRPTRLLPKALAKADYNQAIKDVTKRSFTTGSLINQGAVHTYAGNYEEAITIFISALKKLQNSSAIYISVSLAGLAYAKDRLDNFEEALPLYEMAIKILPENPIPYRSLVAAYNDHQIHPDRALEISHEMMNHLQPNRLDVVLEIAGNSIFKMTHALALANAGQFEDVQSLIDQARQKFDFNFKPGNAQFHHIHARIMLAMNKTDEAVAMLNKAFQIDPNGDAGKFAKSILDNISDLDATTV